MSQLETAPAITRLMGINEVAERFGQKPQTIRAHVRRERAMT